MRGTAIKPCGHPKAVRHPKCRVCYLYATNEKYRRLWDGEPQPVPVECAYRGEPLSGFERNRLGLSSANWAPCSHPDRPKGEYVCPCSGCGPKCVGFVAGESDDVT